MKESKMRRMAEAVIARIVVDAVVVGIAAAMATVACAGDLLLMAVVTATRMMKTTEDCDPGKMERGMNLLAAIPRHSITLRKVKKEERK